MAAPVGNKFAAKAKKFEGALKRALIRNDGALNRIADQLVATAEAGDAWAIQMIADRLDGKAKQQTEVSGPNGGPIEANVTHGLSDATRGLLESLSAG